MLKGRELSDRGSQIDSLDGLRGVAVLLVVLSHTSNIGIFLLPGADFSGTGKSGVFLFFLLSSFLLSLPFIRRGASALRWPFLANYAFRRFTRIYPLFLLYLVAGMLAGAVLLPLLGKGQIDGFLFGDWREVADHLLLLAGKGVTWSIAVEFHYYLFLPLVALAYPLLCRNRVVPSVALTLLLILLAQWIWPQSESLVNDIRLGPYLPIFFIGALTALLYHRWQESPWHADPRARWTLELAGLGAVAAAVAMIPSVSRALFDASIPDSHYHKAFILYAALWALVLFASVAGGGVLRRLFENGMLRYLGFISFSVYLWHWVVIGLIRWAEWPLPRPVQGWIVLALTLALSHATWYFVERPASRIGWGRRRAATAVAG